MEKDTESGIEKGTEKDAESGIENGMETI
jgi:hypothetical protein